MPKGETWLAGGQEYATGKAYASYVHGAGGNDAGDVPAPMSISPSNRLDVARPGAQVTVVCGGLAKLR
jgi:hypothetical protein